MQSNKILNADAIPDFVLEDWRSRQRRDLGPSAGRAIDGIVGWTEWTLRNEDGSVAASGVDKNIFTRAGRRDLVSAPSAPSLPGFIAILDDEHPTGIKDDLNCFRSDNPTVSPSPFGTPSLSYNFSTLVKTFTISFAAPSVPRTVRKIATYWVTNSDEGGATKMASYLELTPPVVQQTTQTFEIVYRQAFVLQSSGKTLKRWQTFSAQDELALATDMLDGADTGRVNFTFATFGKYAFIDQGASYRATHQGGNGPGGAGSSFFHLAPNFATQSLWRRGATMSQAIVNADNDANVGGRGMAAFQRRNEGPSSNALNVDNQKTYGFFPLTMHEGELSDVFAHPAGETYLWNVIGSVALSQGAVEVQGPYRPDDQAVPTHKAFWVTMKTSGDTDLGTEGTYYVVRSSQMLGYPYPSYYGAEDNYWLPAMRPRWLVVSTAEGYPNTNHHVCFDGRDSYWAVTFVTGIANARVWRWRAHSNEQIFQNVVEDTTRFFGAPAPTAGTTYRGCVSDEDGTVYVGREQGAVSPALHSLLVFDARKPGRHYQRPSGIASGGDNTFDVDPDDEIHLMFPFTTSSPTDVGRKIRIVNSTAGNDGVRTITAVNGPNSIDVDGPVLNAEVGMTWHFVCAEERGLGQLGGRPMELLYDKVNGRLWLITLSDGLQVSTDGGATWSALITELNGLTTALAKSFLNPDGSNRPRTAFLGNDGAVYWIDTNNAINKYVGAGPGGTHTRITIASLPGFANGFTKGTITNINIQRNAVDLATGEGAMWIGQDIVFQRGFWRLKLDNFSGAAAEPYDNYTIRGGVFNDYLDHGASTFICYPDGRTMLWNPVRSGQWMLHHTPDLDVSAFGWSLQGAILPGSGAIGVYDMRPDGRFCSFGTGGMPQSSHYGTPVIYRYDDVAGVWRAFEGSAAQFDARYGTTNGGFRKCHAGWEPILGPNQSDNLKIRFVQAGGTVAPTDEFVAAERFTFMGFFGAGRTNVQDLTARYDMLYAGAEQKVEEEPIKVVSGRGSRTVYFSNTTTIADGTALGAANLPIFDFEGENHGWVFRKNTFYDGGANVPATVGTSRGLQAGIDLGSAQAVSKLRVSYWTSKWYYFTRYHRTSGDRGRAYVLWSDDNISWTYVPECDFQITGTYPTGPNPGYRFVYCNMGPTSLDQFAPFQNLTFDLEAAGISLANRTHRYWKVLLMRADGGTDHQTRFGGISCFNAADEMIGHDYVNDAVDEALDADFAGVWIFGAAWIQDRVGLGGKGGISTIDDGDVDGYTDTVSIDSGVFDTGSISTVTDRLAWKEPGAPGQGFIRMRPQQLGGVGGFGFPFANNAQAEARIISVTSSTIVVDRKIIPDNLSAADWEVRRPAPLTGGFARTIGGDFAYDTHQGLLQFADDDIGREFRITKKVVFRIP